MHSSHDFVLSVVAGYAGAAFGITRMRKPSSSNNFNVASCIVTFLFVTYLPWDLGCKIGCFLPIVLVTTVFAHLFCSMRLANFVNVASDDHPWSWKTRQKEAATMDPLWYNRRKYFVHWDPGP
jgi:hypothetical protein